MNVLLDISVNQLFCSNACAMEAAHQRKEKFNAFRLIPITPSDYGDMRCYNNKCPICKKVLMEVANK